MIHIRYMWQERVKRLIVGFLCCWVMAGCQHGRQQDSAHTIPDENEKLQHALASRDEKIQELEKKVVEFKMQVLEYEASINDLQVRSDSQQQRLDEAIIEVVRTKARLRSLESKAEAASTIAEAEIAVNAIKKQIASADKGTQDQISTADQLLKMSVQEFKSLNYGGALYLANQTKGQVRAVRNRISGNTPMAVLDGETLFSQPLPLKLLKNSNLRQGPGLEQIIIGTLSKGTLVVGYSHKGSWVRVETTEGMAGWLFQSLIGTR